MFCCCCCKLHICEAANVGIERLSSFEVSGLVADPGRSEEKRCSGHLAAWRKALHMVCLVVSGRVIQETSIFASRCDFGYDKTIQNIHFVFLRSWFESRFQFWMIWMTRCGVLGIHRIPQMPCCGSIEPSRLVVCFACFMVLPACFTPVPFYLSEHVTIQVDGWRWICFTKPLVDKLLPSLQQSVTSLRLRPFFLRLSTKALQNMITVTGQRFVDCSKFGNIVSKYINMFYIYRYFVSWLCCFLLDLDGLTNIFGRPFSMLHVFFPRKCVRKWMPALNTCKTLSRCVAMGPFWLIVWNTWGVCWHLTIFWGSCASRTLLVWSDDAGGGSTKYRPAVGGQIAQVFKAVECCAGGVGKSPGAVDSQGVVPWLPPFCMWICCHARSRLMGNFCSPQFNLDIGWNRVRASNWSMFGLKTCHKPAGLKSCPSEMCLSQWPPFLRARIAGAPFVVTQERVDGLLSSLEHNHSKKCKKYNLFKKKKKMYQIQPNLTFCFNFCIRSNPIQWQLCKGIRFGFGFSGVDDCYDDDPGADWWWWWRPSLWLLSWFQHLDDFDICIY